MAAVVSALTEPIEITLKNSNFSNVNAQGLPTDWTASVPSGTTASVSNGRLTITDNSSTAAAVIISSPVSHKSSIDSYKLTYSCNNSGTNPVSLGIRVYNAAGTQINTGSKNIGSTSGGGNKSASFLIDEIPLISGYNKTDIAAFRVVIYTASTTIGVNSYIAEMKLYENRKIAVSEPVFSDGFAENGKELSATVKTASETGINPPITLALALYDRSDFLVYLSWTSGNTEVTATLNIPENAPCGYVKAFTLENLDSLKPVNSVKKIPSLGYSLGNVEYLGDPIGNSQMLDSAYGIEDGYNMMYTTVSGNPAVFVVYNIDLNRVERSFNYNGALNECTSHGIDASGNVYTVSDKDCTLYRYSPSNKKFTMLGSVEGETAAYHISIDENQNVYFGTFPNAKIIKYDVQRTAFHDYGTIFPGESYVHSQIYHNGYIYAGGSAASSSFARLNASTGAVQLLSNPQKAGLFTQSEINSYYAMKKNGNYIYALIKLDNGSYVWAIYDLTAGRWLPDKIYERPNGMYPSDPKNGFSYLGIGGELNRINISTLELTPLGIQYSDYLRGSAVIGNSIVSVSLGEGKPVFINLSTGAITFIENSGIPSRPFNIQSMGAGPRYDFFIAGYQGTKGARYDTLTGKFEIFPLGQSENMISGNGEMFFGVYTNAKLLQYNYGKKEAVQVGTGGTKQDRPFAFAAGENKIFMGTIPTYGSLGGALSIYNIENKKRSTVYNIVNNQSIMGLAYKDGLVYGSTGIWGGYGIVPTETEAKIFVWDLKEGTKIREFVPVIPGNTRPIMGIGDLSFGPDGLLWCSSKGLIFAIDPETMQVVKQVAVAGYSWYADIFTWKPTYIRWDKNGYMYTNPVGVLTVIDPETLNYKHINTGGESNAFVFTIAADNNIYFASQTSIYKISTTKNLSTALKNGDFSSVNGQGLPSNWMVSAPAGTTASVSNGQLNITDNSASAAAVVTSSPILPSSGIDTYEMTYDCKNSGLSIGLRLYNADGNQINSGSYNIGTTSGGGSKLLNFTISEIPLTVYDDIAYFRIVIYTSSTGTGINSFISNIKLQPRFDFTMPLKNGNFSSVNEQGMPFDWSISTSSGTTAQVVSTGLRLTDSSTSAAISATSAHIPLLTGVDDYGLHYSCGNNGSSPMSLGIRVYDSQGNQLNLGTKNIGTTSGGGNKIVSFKISEVPLSSGYNYDDIYSFRIIIYTSSAGTRINSYVGNMMLYGEV